MFLPAWAGLALLWTPTFPQHTYVESHPWFNILAGSPVEIRIFVMNCISPILGLFWEPLRPPMLAVCTNRNLDQVLLLHQPKKNMETCQNIQDFLDIYEASAK